MVMEFTNGLTQVFTKEIGNKTKYLATVSIRGTTEELTKDTGITTTCTARAFTPGPTAGNTKENT